jgi:hypothetical protein
MGYELEEEKLKLYNLNAGCTFMEESRYVLQMYVPLGE